MADAVESGEGEELDVVFVSDDQPIQEEVQEEPKPEGRTLSDAEYQALIEKGETSRQMLEPLTQMAERLGREQPANVQQPSETEEEFYARMEQQAFMPGQFGKVMQEVNKRTMAPVVTRMGQIVMDQAKRLMRVDPERGEMFRKFEKEIEQEVQATPVAYRGPEVYEEAYQKVMLRKQPELFEMRMATEREKMKAEILAELGVQPGQQAVKKPAIQSLGQRASAPNAQAGESRQSIRLFESEANRMLNAGMNPKDPMQVQSWLKNHPRRK